MGLDNSFGQCLAIDRRYESDRWHGGRCRSATAIAGDVSVRCACSTRRWPCPTAAIGGRRRPPDACSSIWKRPASSGGAGTVAFLVGCGYFDFGAFQVRQFLLTSFSAERALLAAAAELFGDADLIVTYNGKTFDVPVMETRWAFHRMRGAARRGAAFRHAASGSPAVASRAACSRTTAGAA